MIDTENNTDIHCKGCPKINARFELNIKENF